MRTVIGKITKMMMLAGSIVTQLCPGLDRQYGNKLHYYGFILLLAGGALLWGSAAHAAGNSGWDTSDWPQRTAEDRSRIVTLMHNHETVLVLDLLREGKRQKAENILFAMLDLNLMDVSNPNTPFSPGEWKALCQELGPLGKLETSKMFRSHSQRDPNQASNIRANIAKLRKSCASH